MHIHRLRKKSEIVGEKGKVYPDGTNLKGCYAVQQNVKSRSKEGEKKS